MVLYCRRRVLGSLELAITAHILPPSLLVIRPGADWRRAIPQSAAVACKNEKRKAPGQRRTHFISCASRAHSSKCGQFASKPAQTLERRCAGGQQLICVFASTVAPGYEKSGERAGPTPRAGGLSSAHRTSPSAACLVRQHAQTHDPSTQRRGKAANQFTPTCTQRDGGTEKAAAAAATLHVRARRLVRSLDQTGPLVQHTAHTGPNRL